MHWSIYLSRLKEERRIGILRGKGHAMTKNISLVFAKKAALIRMVMTQEPIADRMASAGVTGACTFLTILYYTRGRILMLAKAREDRRSNLDRECLYPH